MLLEGFGIYSLAHMTHIANLDSIFKKGLLAHDNPYKRVDISNYEVNARRNKRETVYGRKIHDYVPFYFNPRNAMMYRNKDEDIIILGFNDELLLEKEILFTNQNAATTNVSFFSDLDDLNKLNWGMLKSDSWYQKAEVVKQTMMAEVLVPQRVSMDYLQMLYVKDAYTQEKLYRRYGHMSIDIIVDKNLFFKY